jgi:mono/diheme cytochrome c family protein
MLIKKGRVEPCQKTKMNRSRVIGTLMLLAQPAQAADISMGRQIAENECSSCHAFGATGASPNPKSPPFRDVVKHYPRENFVESLAEGIVTGHNEMPEFIFEPQEITETVTYLNSLTVKN